MLKDKINLYLIEFAISSLLRSGGKNIFISIIFTFLVFLLMSTFLVTSSIKSELDSTVESLPQIIVQKIRAGRHCDMSVDMTEEIITIAGVKSAMARVWGYYYFANEGINFSIVGIDPYEEQYRDSLSKITERFDFDRLSEGDGILVGRGVKEVLEKSYYREYFNFIKPDGNLKKMYIAGVFDGDTKLESNDIILMSKDDAREIFDMSPGMATDIVVEVSNPKEIDTVASKIRLSYPDSRVVTNNELKVSYQNIFDYKSGIFLAMFTIVLFTFFIIVYDKVSGLSSEEKREIGVLKAVGWSIDDVLKEKFYEAFIISSLSYLLGVLISFWYIYILQAPLLRDIFVGYSRLRIDFELPFVFDIETLFLVFLLSVPIYIGATILPSWRASTLDVDEVIR